MQKASFDMLWECKECHRFVTDDETVAYHLVNRILYGWCDACFNTRSSTH